LKGRILETVKNSELYLYNSENISFGCSTLCG